MTDSTAGSSTGGKVRAGGEVLPAKLTISRPERGGDRGAVTITVHDGVGASKVLELSVSVGAFTDALFGLAHVPCVAEWRNVERIGCMRELREQLVRVPDGPWREREQRAADALRQFEVDGWRGNVDQATNSKCTASRGEDGSTVQRVTFTRFVRPDGSPLA